MSQYGADDGNGDGDPLGKILKHTIIRGGYKENRGGV